MISFAGYRTGFPFRFKTRSANGLPFEQWDGITTDLGSPSSDSGAEVYGIGTFRPFGLTSGELAKLYWRIKTIQVSYNYTFNYDEGSYSASGTGLEAVIQNPIGTDIPSEPYLVADEATHYASESLATIGVSILQIDYGDTWLADGLLYPSIRIGMGGLFSNVASGSEGGGIGNPVSGLTVAFLDFGSLDLWGSNVLATAGKSPPYSGSGAIEVESVEWWGYNGKWNTTTGAPA
jgi:hypothetical protein